MAIEKTIKINVDTTEGVKDTDKLAKSLKNVDTQAEKTSNELQKVGDNGGAIAVLDNLTGGLATQMKDAFEATKLFNFSLKGTRTALIATGVGVFLVALGGIVAYWDEIIELINGANKKLQEQVDLNNKNLEALDHEKTLLDKQLEIIKLQGGSVEEIRKSKEKIILLQQEENLLLLENLRIQLAKEEAQNREITWWEQIKIATADAFTTVGKEEMTRRAISAESEKSLATAKLIEEADLRRLDLQKQLLLLEQSKNGEGGIVTLDEDGREKEEGLNLEGLEEQLALEAQARLNAAKGLNDALLAEEERVGAGLVKIDKRTAQERKAIDESLKNAKISIGTQTLNILGSLAKEGSDLAKGIAASQATINTIQGVTSALSATSVIPDPFGTILKFVNAAAIGVAGAINVKKILSTKPVTTSAPSGGGATPPPAPSFNLVEGTASNQIADSVNSGTQPVKTFVVSGDVTSKQELDRNIEDNSSL